jgi:hypothetical protein
MQFKAEQHRTRSPWKSASLKAAKALALAAAVAVPLKASACGQSIALINSAVTQKGNTSVPFPDFSFNAQPGIVNPLLVVHLDLGSGGTPPASVLYGNQPMTKLLQNPDANAGTQQVWYLASPLAGPHALRVDTSGNNVPYNVEAALFGGVNQSTPIGAVAQDINTSYSTNYVTHLNTQHPVGLIVDFVSYGTGDAPAVTLGGGQFQAFTFNASPASTVSSELQFGHAGGYQQSYTFQWADAYSSQTIELVACP